MSQVPFVTVAIGASMAARIAVFHDTVSFRWSVAPAAICIGVCLYALFLWTRHTTAPPDVERIRRQMRIFSAILVVGGPAAVFASINLLNETSGYGKYFVLLQMALHAICLSVTLIPLGFATYVYAGVMMPTAILAMAMSGLEYTLAQAFILAVYSAGTIAAMHIHARRLDRLVMTQADLQRLGDQNARLANLDALTGLPNRRSFFARLDEILAGSSTAGERFAVGILDLDGFKPLNDSYGHRVGDRVLAEIARRLEEAVSSPNAPHRLGGDEFAFLIGGFDDEAGLRDRAQAIIHAVEAPMRIDDLVLTVGCSIGLSIGPDAAGRPDALFEQADFVLSRAKQMGRGNAQVFSAAHRAELQASGAIEQALRGANLETELHAVFQPIVDISTGAVQGFESLARWHSPALGPVSPADFIPIAERAGLVTAITLTLLRQAIEALREWPDEIELSFNLSPHDVMNGLTVLRLIREVTESGIAPRRFVFELTETALLQDFATARDNVELLRRAGVRIAIDDFGAGYSSLAHVQALPLDKLKIDRRFVKDIETDATSRMIVRSLVGLCGGLGIGCVAEGAETEAQVAALRALGCESVQGWYYAKPMVRAMVGPYLAGHRADVVRAA